MSTKDCSCGGALAEVFIPDFSASVIWTAVWVAGKPDPKKSFGEWFRTGVGPSVEGHDARLVEAWRCTTCGRLELYANRVPVGAESPART